MLAYSRRPSSVERALDEIQELAQGPCMVSEAVSDQGARPVHAGLFWICALYRLLGKNSGTVKTNRSRTQKDSRVCHNFSFSMSWMNRTEDVRRCEADLKS